MAELKSRKIFIELISIHIFVKVGGARGRSLTPFSLSKSLFWPVAPSNFYIESFINLYHSRNYTNDV